MKRLLIIGASILQLPAIKKAKEMGFCVAVADYNPKAVGIPFADEYFNVSTVDEEGVYLAAKQFGADGIMTLATDMPMRSLAYAATKLGLSGISYETAIKSTDKGEMIKAFRENGVAHPWYFLLSDASDLESVSDQITYPCISKPTDNSGSRGVMLVNTPAELKAAVEYSSSQGRNGRVIIEEYLQGPEVSVEVMTVNGIPHILQVTDKLTTGAPHFVEMGHSQPSRLGEKNINAIKELAAKAVKAVGIENGPAHVEIVLTEKGPKMIELGARMGGDCITTHLVPLSTGIDMVKATIQMALGEQPDIEPAFEKGAAIRFINGESGTIKSISGVEDAKNSHCVVEAVLTKQVGEAAVAVKSSVDRSGYVIAQAATAEAAVDCCIAAADKIEITII